MIENSSTGLQTDRSCCNLLSEGSVVLHKKHGRAAGEEQILELDSGEDIDIVQRLIPDKEMCRFTERFCQKHLFLLPLAVSFDPCLKLRAFQSKLGQYSAKE